MQPIVIYHKNCADGFAAAWAARLAHPDWEFYPAVHSDPPPIVRDRQVYLVDFCFKRPVMEQLLDEAEFVCVLDHHKSAMEDCQSLMFREHKPLRGIFDMERSGAGITWDWFHPGKPRPPLLDRVEDRDLWRFAFPNTKAVQASLFSFPYDFDIWTDLMLHRKLEDLEAEGIALMRKHMKDIEELIATAAVRKVVLGTEVPVLNCPYFHSSEAGNVMAQGEAFAVCYYDAKEGRRFSLRSAADGVDVSAIAKRYGGGGHFHAAGFTMPWPFSWEQLA